MTLEYFNNLSNNKSSNEVYFKNDDFSPVQKSVRKMAISCSFEGFRPTDPKSKF